MGDAARLRSVTPPTDVDLFMDVVVDFYAKTAALYDDWADGVNRKAAARLAQLAAVRPDEVVIDAGCGTGLVTRELTLDRAAGGKVLGIDISPAMLEIAEATRPRGAPMVFTRGMVEDLGLPIRSADVVILGQVLALTARPEDVILEARRVLKPGGRIVISAYQRSLLSPVEDVFLTELLRLSNSSFFRIPRRSEQHALLGEPETLRDLLEDAGFSDVQLSNLVVGNHTEDAHSFVELMRLEDPWAHTVLQFTSPAERERFEQRLAGVVRFFHDAGRFVYHRPFTFAVAHRM